jgi:DNA-binding CsgD family transcriptional regulator
MDFLSNMNNIPGTLIFNLKGKLLYFNQEALEYLPRLKDRMDNTKGPLRIPEEILFLEIRFLFEKTKHVLNNGRPKRSGEFEQSVISNNDRQLLLRSFPVGDQNHNNSGNFILLLIEPASKDNLMDLPQVATAFQLSHREIEVIQLICRGKTNKEIGDLLFISPQTVKDHLKNIMRKMKVNSRTKIMAALLNLPKDSVTQ